MTTLKYWDAALNDYVPIPMFDRTGSLLPPPLLSTDPFTSFVDDTGVVWVAQGSANNGAWKRATDALFVHWFRTAADTVPNGGKVLDFDNMVKDDYGLYHWTTGLHAPVAGLWDFRCHHTMSGGMPNNSNYGNIHSNIQGDLVSVNYSPSHSWGGGPLAVGIFLLAVNEQITYTVSTTNAPGNPLQGGKAQCFYIARYMGTG